MLSTILYPSAQFIFNYVQLFDFVLRYLKNKIKIKIMCGWRKGVFWALPTHCPLPFPIPFFSHPSFLQSAAPTQAHAHGAKDGETGILAGLLCSATIPLSHSLLLFLPLSLFYKHTALWSEELCRQRHIEMSITIPADSLFARMSRCSSYRESKAAQRRLIHTLLFLLCSVCLVSRNLCTPLSLILNIYPPEAVARHATPNSTKSSSSWAWHPSILDSLIY